MTHPVQFRRPADSWLACPRCGSSEFVGGPDGAQVYLECGWCGKRICTLPRSAVQVDECQVSPDHPAHQPPAPASRWAGFVQASDQIWRPVCEAPTRDLCWHGLMHFPGEGIRLVISVLPEATVFEEEALRRQPTTPEQQER